MKCPKCGKELTENDNFCPECGEKIIREVAKPEEKRIVQSMENSTFLCMISMICYFGWGIIAAIIGSIGSVFPPLEVLQGLIAFLPLAGLILAIVAWAKYPKATFPKVLTIVYIVLSILAIFIIILLAASCVGIFRELIEAAMILWL